MIQPTADLLRRFLQENPVSGRVLEVGSLDVNGNVNEILGQHFKEHIKMDMREGNNVDLVLNGHDIKKHFKEEEFDFVFCVDTLEHDDKFWITVENMRWVLKKGGWLFLGAPSLRHPRHNHPNDYYRFFETSFASFLEGYKGVHVEYQCYSNNGSEFPDQIYGYGQKP